MRLPWQPAAEELFALRGHGGQTFADFVSALLRAEGSLRGLPATDINTSTRVNIADGGVDAEVRSPLGGPLALASPTCWQFKATQFSEFDEKDLRKEANKPEAKRLIAAGYGYYVCVCDDWPSNKMGELDAALREIIREINPDAPVPRVLNAGHLADWASHHPAIVLQFFRGHLGQSLAYEPWLRKEREPLSRFVELSARIEAMEAIHSHVCASAGRPVLSIVAPSGAGVSRLVAEALCAVASRVIYIPDDTTAVAFATSLVNQANATGVLVVDRCRASVRMALDDLVKAEGARLRVVVINDPTEQATSATVKVGALEDSDVQKVIDANFEGIPASHRRAFVHFADGILKIAARLATSYSADRTRFLLNEAAWADDELRRLVRDERDRHALRALSLFNRVGFARDLSSQLVEVCGLFGLDLKEVMRRSKRLASAPGVVAVGERYLSVRPRLFARPLFESAWAEAVGDDVGFFVDSLSPALQSALLKQSARHAPQEIRDALADWAIPRVLGIPPGELGSSTVHELLLPMVEVAPARMGPVLTNLVMSSTPEQAGAPGERMNHWPARMHVVWTLRQLMERRETYSLAERALFRLAQAEGVPEDAGRQTSVATEQWTTSFRLFLSGTEVSLQDRLSALASKVDEYGTEAIPYVVAALGFTVSSHASKTEGVPLVYGDIRRPDWQPATYGEYWDSLNGAIALLGRCAADATHRGRAIAMLVRHGRGLLQSGRVNELRVVFEGVDLDETQRVAVRGFVNDFLVYDVKGQKNGGEGYPAEYTDSVVDWHKSLARDDLSARAVEALAPSYRRQFDETAAWTEELNALGVELHGHPEVLRSLVPLFVDGKHHGGGLFAIGRSVGKADVEGTLLDALLAAAKDAKTPLFHRGYVCGLGEHGDKHDARLCVQFDRLEESNPGLAVDLSGMNSRTGGAGTRAIRLVRAGRLPAESLTRIPSLRFEGDSFSEAIELVLDRMQERPEDAAATALDLLGSLAWDETATLPKDSRGLAAIWRAVEIAVDGAHGETHAWGRLLRRLSDVDFERAVRLACTVAVRGDFAMQDEAACELSVYIGRAPSVVLSILGPMLLDPNAAWTFGGGRRGTVLISFPFEVLRDWISQHGADAARIVANHMPSPHLDANGNPAVPPLTAFVLEKFETDDKVFSTFCSSRHNLQMYSGDIAAQHEAEASLAEKFRTHGLRRIREWSDYEVRWGRRDAQRWREHSEEEFDE